MRLEGVRSWCQGVSCIISRWHRENFGAAIITEVLFGKLNLFLSRCIRFIMFGIARYFPSIKRIKFGSVTLPQNLRIRHRNCRLLPAAIRTTIPFSTTARRKQQKRREVTTWHGLEWVGSQEWLDAYMTPRKPLKP